jgi:hypothetical protein
MKTLGEYILVIDSAIPDHLCESLIELYDNCKNKIARDSSTYKFSEANLAENAEFYDPVFQLQSITQRVYDAYVTETKANFLPTEHGYEQFRMKKYEANGSDHFDWHTDVGDYASAKRYLVMFYYLNNVDKGGETLFALGEEEYRVSPKAGRVVCFPPNFMFPHKGTMPVSGPKYIISTYGHYL